jgi:Glycosyltransferase
MNIVHVVVSDSDGGAARAAYRINTAINNLNDANYKSNMLVLNKNTIDNSVHTVLNSISKRVIYKLKKGINEKSIDKYNNSTFFSNDIMGIDISKEKIIRECDIINLHWVNNAMLSFEYLEKLKRLNKTMVWTLHDMCPFTGGCHYDEGCEKYKGKCGKCKVLNSNVDKDLSYKIQKKKIQLFSNMNISIVGCSNWITKCARDSKILENKRCINIPNPINHNVFKPLNKEFARKALNIKSEKKIILFGAMSSDSDKRKGYEQLIESLKKMDLEKYKIVIFGNETNDKYLNRITNATYIGKVYDDFTLSLIYNCADVFVAPSIQENLANTVMEALACGTPVTAFKIGGMEDMIKHEFNGYLANPFKTSDFANGIEWCIENTNELSLNAREYVINNYKSNIIANKYIDLYTSTK